MRAADAIDSQAAQRRGGGQMSRSPRPTARSLDDPDKTWIHLSKLNGAGSC